MRVGGCGWYPMHANVLTRAHWVIWPHLRRRALKLRMVDIRLPGKENSNSHGARPVHPIISMIEWTRTSRLSMMNSLFGRTCAAVLWGLWLRVLYISVMQALLEIRFKRPRSLLPGGEGFGLPCTGPGAILLLSRVWGLGFGVWGLGFGV